ncbi:MAG: hypothetical protein AMXMBFR47_46120 [Planctomycetota bacterium]
MKTRFVFLAAVVFSGGASWCAAQTPPPPVAWSVPFSPGFASDAAFDIFGNLVVAGYVLDTGGERDLVVRSFAPEGNLQWEYRYGAGSADGGSPLQVIVDLDGNVIVVGEVRGSMAAPVERRPFAINVSASGVLRWFSLLPHVDPANPWSGTALSVAVDDEGVVYMGAMEVEDSPPHGRRRVIARLNPLTGAVEWIGYIPDDGGDRLRVETDRRGNPYFAYDSGTGAGSSVTIRAVNTQTGATTWSDTLAGADDPLLDTKGLDGTIVLAARRTPGDQVVTFTKYQLGGARVWQSNFVAPSGTRSPRSLTRARDGTIYCAGYWSNAANNDSAMSLISMSSTGSVRWEYIRNAVPAGQTEGAFAVATDRLGNPYIAGVAGSQGVVIKIDRDAPTPAWTTPATAGASLFFRLAIDNGYGIVAAGDVLARFNQQYIDIPEVYRNTVDFRIEQASIWHPDFPSFEFERRFGTGDICWNQSNGTDCQYNLSFDDVDEGRSAAGYGGRVQIRTDGRLRFGFRAEATAGSVDIAYPGDAEIVIPGSAKWTAGKPVSIETSWTPSANAGLTGRGRPTLNAGLTVSGGVDVFADARAWSREGSVTFFHLNQSRNLNPATYLVSIFGLGGGAWQNGIWFSLCEPTNYVCGNWRIPPLDVNASLVNGQMASHAADLFMAIRGNLTQIMSVNLLGFPTIVRYPPAQGGAGGAYDAWFEFRLMQAYIQHSFEAVQNITWTPQPKVRFIWSDPGFPTQEIPLGQNLEFSVPPGWDGDVTITPVVRVDGALRNETSIRFIPNLGFESASLSGNITVGPITVFSEDVCLGCIESPDPGLPPFPGYDRTYDLSPDAKQMAPILVNGTGLSSLWPVVSAASRESLPMILYDQINPRQSSFNGVVNRSTRLLIYGDRFTATHNPIARIEHAGAAEYLSTTRLNNNTLLVEIPNRFRVVPGVARLSVRLTVSGQARNSNKIDLPIEYPIPNLATVNPNLWAADPALKTVPVSVIDGLSSAGNHTFIARRDYYLVLRDQLWNASTAGGVGAAAYFPDFDFNAMPGFPMVMFGGVPLSRFEQPIDNGIHNVRLPEASYAAPGVVDVFLENPPPEQGLSQTVRLNIAAPRPVISGFEPPTVPPGEAFTLIVKGPANVPFWQGYEEPKYGNFTAASVVLWDGVELPTTFIHSGALQAEVPQELVQHAGYHHITVETAAGGSVYFEQLRTGAGAIVWQGTVPSGCSINAAGDVLCGSDPMVFAVEYPQPFIENVGPSTVDACSASGPDQLSVDITIVGTGFAPDCRLFIDGAPRAVTRTSAELLQFTVASAEIAVPGVRFLYVENPGPYGGVSNEMTLEVVLTDCNANGRPDQCEINDGLASDCNGNRIPDSCDIAQGDSGDTNGNGIPDECESGSPCRGDLDGDRDVDISDLAALLARFGMPGGATASDGDSDADGDVDLSDLSVLLGSFGAPCE